MEDESEYRRSVNQLDDSFQRVVGIFDEEVKGLKTDIDMLTAEGHLYECRLKQMMAIMERVNGLIGAGSLPYANVSSSNKEWKRYLKTLCKNTLEALVNSQKSGVPAGGVKRKRDNSNHAPANEKRMKQARSYQGIHRKMQTTDGTIACACGNIYKKTYYIDRHIKENTNGKVFSCPAEGCPYSATRQAHLRSHVRNKHNNAY